MAVAISREELFRLSAVDGSFYCHEFFPKAFRDASPAFEYDFWSKFDDNEHDFFAAEIFRGGGKTTRARAGISRRLALGTNRNILAIAISEPMAAHSVRWLKRQIEFNTKWTSTFQLSKGKKWTDDWIEIRHGLLGHTINVVAKGMTSGLRGLNLDDYRPDLIYCDDICDEENTATEAQREKTDNLFFGAIVQSLAPKSEAKHRKVVLTQTALHKEDIISKAHKDPMFLTVKYPRIYQLESGEWRSNWPTRYPVEEALKEKASYVKRRQLHIWLREAECKVTSSEGTAFDDKWLKYWDVLPTKMVTYIGLDPASSSRKEAHKTAMVVIGIYAGNVYILDTFAQTGKNPEEIWVWLKTAYRKWRPYMVGVESVAYQKMLAWYLREKMKEDNFYFPIHEINDRRSKPDRIRQAYTGIASQGALYVSANNTDFIQQFSEYTDKIDSDLLDAGAMAICEANPWMIQGGEDFDDFESVNPADEDDMPTLAWRGGAP